MHRYDALSAFPLRPQPAAITASNPAPSQSTDMTLPDAVPDALARIAPATYVKGGCCCCCCCYYCCSPLTTFARRRAPPTPTFLL